MSRYLYTLEKVRFPFTAVYTLYRYRRPRRKSSTTRCTVVGIYIRLELLLLLLLFAIIICSARASSFARTECDFVREICWPSGRFTRSLSFAAAAALDEYIAALLVVRCRRERKVEEKKLCSARASYLEPRISLALFQGEYVRCITRHVDIEMYVASAGLSENIREISEEIFVFAAIVCDSTG